MSRHTLIPHRTPIVEDLRDGYTLYRLVNYDVWGNPRDGYEVNDAHYTGDTLALRDDLPNGNGPSDAEVIRALKRCGYLKPGIRARSLKIEGEPGFSLYVGTADTYRREPGRPLCELRAVRPDAT
jgi:hypothetical protein